MSTSDFEKDMGEVTRLAYSKIKNNSFKMNKELDIDEVLDYLEDGNNFKKISDLMKETMIYAGILKDTPTQLKNFDTVIDFLEFTKTADQASKININDSIDCYIESLFALLEKQEEECEYNTRKYEWDKKTIRQWFIDAPEEQEHNRSDSIGSKDDAIYVCFALGLDYDSTQDFLNKCGHMILNIRIPEDAIYMYCLLNHRPLSKAKELIHKYYMEESDNLTKEDINKYKIASNNSGNTTRLLITTMFENSSWENDESFLNTFLLPNKENFIAFSNCALREFLKLKVPIFLYFIWNGLESTISKKIATKLYDLLKEYSGQSAVIKSEFEEVSHLLLQHDEKDKDNYILANVILDISLGIDYYTITTDELLVISKFSQSLLSPNAFLSNVVPMLSRSGNKNYGKYKVKLKDKEVWMDKSDDKYWIETLDNEFIRYITKEDFDRIKKSKISKKNDTRSMNMSDSTLGNTALASFPNQQYYADYLVIPENNPGRIKLRQSITLRKAIIFFFYLKYVVYGCKAKLAGPSLDEDFEYDLGTFIEKLNEILGICQLGKLYLGNQYDWMILECAANETMKNYNDEDEDEDEDEDDRYVTILNRILKLSVF